MPYLITHEGGEGRKRLTARERREQLLYTAAAEFAKTGLNGTTTLSLARAAGISEPILYAHFSDKECLFREVVRRVSEARLRALQVRLEPMAAATPRQCLEELIEATISVCLSAPGSPLLTNWSLLEVPEFAAEIHRQEIGTVTATWERRLYNRFPDPHLVPVRAAYAISGAVQVCYSYALWLGTLHHTDATAAPLVKQFAAGTAEAALALIRESVRRGLRTVGVAS